MRVLDTTRIVRGISTRNNPKHLYYDDGRGHSRTQQGKSVALGDPAMSNGSLQQNCARGH